MNVLVACEFSGIVRNAFAKKGHNAWSCDLLPTEMPGNHYHGNIDDILFENWDLLIAHPPCQFLSNSGAKHLYIDGKLSNGKYLPRWRDLRNGAQFFKKFAKAKHIPLRCIENPIMHKHAKQLIQLQQSQIVQPYMFGHLETKATCLWLWNLPLLSPTNDVKGEMMKLPYNIRARCHMMLPSPTRSMDRSRTFLGIADAMAEQWGSL